MNVIYLMNKGKGKWLTFEDSSVEVDSSMYWSILKNTLSNEV